MPKEKRFETIIGSELGRCHKDGPHAIWPDAAEETTPALLACHTDEAIDGMLIISALGSREGGVMLHSDVQNVCGIASHTTEETRRRSHCNERWKVRRRVSESFQVFVYAKAGG